MGDVVEICRKNHALRRWADEEAAKEAAAANAAEAARQRSRRNRQRRELLKTASTGFAMACGSAATLLAFGLAEMHLPTVIISALCGGVFLIAGAAAQERL